MNEKPWLKTESAADAIVHDLREQIVQLQLKELKLRFMLATMPKMCVHYEQKMVQLHDGRFDVTLVVGQIHALDRSPQIRDCIVDIESFEIQLDKFMKEFRE
jgi:uncharacterized protein (DUF849 family)